MEKKKRHRFTIQLNPKKENHSYVADKLNALSDRKKADYIVAAVMCFNNKNEVPSDEKDNISFLEQSKDEIVDMLNLFKV